MQRLVLSGSLTILLFAAALVDAQSPPPAVAISSPVPSVAPIDALDAADLQQAIPIIKSNYVNPAAISETELNRATLAGLLSRLGRGVMLLPARAAATPTPAPYYREIIAGHIGYLRPADLSRTQLQELDITLRGFIGKKVDAIVLDLRASAENSDFDAAAEFAKRFVPKNKSLFALRGPATKQVRAFLSNQDPIYTGLIVVLVDRETAGATEVLAAVLRSHDKAIIIGQTTAGRAVDYSDLPLPSGKILRVAVAEAILPDQHPRFPEGMPPDLPVPLPVEEKQQIFQQSLTKGMAPFVFEADRPHLNEAALLAGTNPEIEAAQAAQQRRARGGDKPALHDAVLQRAVDLVTSIGVYEKQPSRSP
jgi:Peptidase family S41